LVDPVLPEKTLFLRLEEMTIVNSPMVHDILSGTMFPQAYVGEVFILRRDGAVVEVDSPIYGKLSGSGAFFLTNMRFVFHCTHNAKPKNLLSYQLDLGEMMNPKFEQPIFAANYLTVDSRPMNGNVRGDRIKIKFSKGGCGTFLAVLHELLTRVIVAPNAAVVIAAQPVAAQFTPANVGYIDPSDSSVVYVQQPSAPPQ
jgi:hypothetical protein